LGKLQSTKVCFGVKGGRALGEVIDISMKENAF
jgi:hypothetical protein